jgi:hypothetical protein
MAAKQNKSRLPRNDYFCLRDSFLQIICVDSWLISDHFSSFFGDFSNKNIPNILPTNVCKERDNTIEITRDTFKSSVDTG